jgi:putative PIN family toxin of toxin-antitoxin system
MPPLPVVADSNVIISGLYTPGNPRAVLDLARTGAINLYLSRFILHEVVTALAGEKFRWPATRIMIALQALPGDTVDTGPPYLHVVADEADNRILECALAAKADYLITGDRHLLALRRYQRIRVVTPAEFLARERA